MTPLRSPLMGACLATVLGLTVARPLAAQEMDHSQHMANDMASAHTAGHHGAHTAPIGVMADHVLPKGRWMLSYRFMQMQMAGSRDGTTSLTPEEIVTTVPNPFGMPPTLRVVPTDMTMRMHMVGAMYGLTDKITLMAMANILTNEMDHITFQGGMGTTRLGEFTTKSSGFSDTSIGAIFGLYEGEKAHQQLNFSLMLSLPTGSISQTDDILTPMNTRPSPRLPYPMQLGSGSFDLRPGLAASTRLGDWSMGAQVMGTLRMNDNDADYRLGDAGMITAWAAYQFAPWVSASGRLEARHQGKIRGQDPMIMAPVQTADPDNQGGETITALLGVSLAGQQGWMKGNRLSVEFGLPLYRNLSGPQLETDWTLTVGLQKAF
ncbi:MAG: transporter [Pseudomonadota bacterium]